MNFIYNIGTRRIGTRTYQFSLDLDTLNKPAIRVTAPENSFGYCDNFYVYFEDGKLCSIPWSHHYIPIGVTNQLKKAAISRLEKYINVQSPETLLFYQRNHKLIEAVKKIDGIQYEFGIYHNPNLAVFCLKDINDKYLNPCTEYRLYVVFQGTLKRCVAISGTSTAAYDFAREVIDEYKDETQGGPKYGTGYRTF